MGLPSTPNGPQAWLRSCRAWSQSACNFYRKVPAENVFHKRATTHNYVDTRTAIYVPGFQGVNYTGARATRSLVGAVSGSAWRFIAVLQERWPGSTKHPSIASNRWNLLVVAWRVWDQGKSQQLNDAIDWMKRF